MLSEVELFSGLSGEELETVAKHAVTKTFPRNTIVVNEGDISNSLYVIISGKVKVYLSDEEGKEIVINTHGPGEYFGELALFDNQTRSASVITAEKTCLSIISKGAFENSVDRHPQIALKVIRGLVRRLRGATENVKSLALMDVYGRVARLLLQLAEERDGVLSIEEKLTQQDIADRVGSSREMISRILKDLKIGGYIDVQDKQITISETLPERW
jgi:CRP/FNR family cyclic AMP-dependent transcriptional regulator